MANRYWFGGNGNWINAATRFSNSAPVCFTASTSGTTMTVTAGGASLAIGMAVYTVGTATIGVITGGSGSTWTMSVSTNTTSTTMYAGFADTAPSGADIVFLGGVYATGSVTGVATSIAIALTGTVTCAGLFVGGMAPITVTGTSGTLNIAGNLDIATGTVWTATVPLVFSSSAQITTNGVSLTNSLTFDAVGATFELLSALTTTSTITLTRGTFTTNNYNVTCTAFSSSGSAVRTINFGSSTVALSNATTPCNFTVATNLTFNAGTSQIYLSATSATFQGGSQTFYNVTFTNGAYTAFTVVGNNSFNNLSFPAKTAVGLSTVIMNGGQFISGTFSVGTPPNATYRTMITSETMGNQRILTCASISALSDIDFRDIGITGAASPLSGTRFGDCKGNSGITFPAAKTVYFRKALAGNWGDSTVWSLTNGGAIDATAFPLAQDTAVFPSSPTPYPSSGVTVTVNANYNIGTIDMSDRTTNTMTLATGTTTPTIYGNWINGTGTTISGIGNMTFARRGSQTITSAGKTFTQPFTINTPGGSVTLQDALALSISSTALVITAGTFDAATYNVTLSGASSVVASSNSNTRTIAIGSGTWTIAGSGISWNCSNAANLTVTGTGTINLTSGSAKSFLGGGIQTYPTLNHGGTGSLTLTGSNKFANITNTAVSPVVFTGGTTTEFTAFNLNGTSTAARLSITSTTATKAILKKPSTWLMGAGSLDSGNNTGLTFTAGGGIDYLSVSYINGQTTGLIPPVVSYGNFLQFF